MENEMLITFRSITFAQRGQRLLSNFGIRCYLQRTPRYLSERGCGYCLHLRSADAATAVGILRANQAPFGKVYVMKPDGIPEEREI